MCAPATVTPRNRSRLTVAAANTANGTAEPKLKNDATRTAVRCSVKYGIASSGRNGDGNGPPASTIMLTIAPTKSSK